MYQFSDKADTFEFLGPNLPQKWILGSKFQIFKSGFGISILEISCAPIFRQNRQLWLFGPKFAQKWTLGSESTLPIYHLRQFSIKMDNFWFFGLNLRKLLNYVQYFGSNIVEGVAESWVETTMSCVEVDGAGGGGWSWVELSARFSNTHCFHPSWY